MKGFWNNKLLKLMLYTPPVNSMHVEWIKWQFESSIKGRSLFRAFWPGLKSQLCFDSPLYGRLPIISDHYLGPDRRKEGHRNGAWGRKKWGHIWTKRKGDK